MMPKLSLMTLARGARQLVVQEALLRSQNGSFSQPGSRLEDSVPSMGSRPPSDPYLTTERELLYFSWLTPMTNMGASALGAEMITLLAPPFK